MGLGFGAVVFWGLDFEFRDLGHSAPSRVAVLRSFGLEGLWFRSFGGCRRWRVLWSWGYGVMGLWGLGFRV